MGEGFFCLSVALVFGHFTNLWAWTYFACIVALFTYRQFDDDKHCEKKYGAEKWAKYKARASTGSSPPSTEQVRRPAPAGMVTESRAVAQLGKCVDLGDQKLEVQILSAR